MGASALPIMTHVVFNDDFNLKGLTRKEKIFFVSVIFLVIIGFLSLFFATLLRL